MPTETIDTYLRGILSRPHPAATSKGFLREGLNVCFPGGQTKSRPGVRPFHGADCAGVISGMGWHVKSDNTRELLVAAGSAIQRVPEGGDPITLPLTNLPSTLQTRISPGRAKFLSISGGLNTTFISDGTNTNLVWDGVALARVGVDEGPTPDTTPVMGVGVVTPGIHKFVTTLDSGRHEGNPTTDPIEVTFGQGENATFTSPTALAIDDPSVLTWHLYGTITAPGEDFFHIASADIGVDIEFNLADVDLAASRPVEEFNNRLQPNKFVELCEHRGQLVAVTDDDLNLLRWSNLNKNYMVPEGWPLDWMTPIAHGDGDEISALVSFFEWLIVFKKNSTWAVTGVWPDTAAVPVLASGGGEHIGIGVQAPGAIFHLENEIIFASRDGMYVIERFASANGGVQAKRITGAIDDLYSAANFEFSADSFFDRKRRIFGMAGHG